VDLSIRVMPAALADSAVKDLEGRRRAKNCELLPPIFPRFGPGSGVFWGGGRVGDHKTVGILGILGILDADPGRGDHKNVGDVGDVEASVAARERRGIALSFLLPAGYRSGRCPDTGGIV
jgi:hypothetical protein